MRNYISIILTIAYLPLLVLVSLGCMLASLPLIILIVFQFLNYKRNATKSKNPEIISVIHSLMYNYKRGKPLIKCALDIPQKEASIGGEIRKIAKLYFLGYSCAIDSAVEPWQLKYAKNTVKRGLENGSGVIKDFDLLEDSINKSEKYREEILMRSNGMSLLTRIGVVFFFPLFSGISLNIISSSLSISGASQWVLSAFTATIIGYIALSVFVNMSLSNISDAPSSVLYQIMPYFSIALLLFFASSRYLVYAL